MCTGAVAGEGEAPDHGCFWKMEPADFADGVAVEDEMGETRVTGARLGDGPLPAGCVRAPVRA